MTASLVRGRVNGFDSVVLENERLRAVVLPQLGGRVWELHDKLHDRQWIWHRDDVPLARVERGAPYDDVWAGGWEELFPNDAPGDFEGRLLPDHGEWWTLDFQIVDELQGPDVVLRLKGTTAVRRAVCEKEFSLRSGSAELQVRYRISNSESEAFHFLFKQHLPVLIGPECELLLPGGKTEVVDPSFGTIAGSSPPFPWLPPGAAAGAAPDLRVIPPRNSGAREFVYVSELPDGWCGVRDNARGCQLRMRFDTAALPYVWLFLTYGGWRDCYTAVLEPCTTMPKDLREALRRGQTARLPAGGTFQTTVAVALSSVS